MLWLLQFFVNKLHNGESMSIERVNLNTNQVLTSRQTKYTPEFLTEHKRLTSLNLSVTYQGETVLAPLAAHTSTTIYVYHRRWSRKMPPH